MSALMSAPEIEQFLAHYDGSTSQPAYWHGLQRYFRAAGIVTIDEAKAMTRAKFASVIRALERKYKPGTVKQTLTTVRQWYQTLQIEDESVVDPTVGQKHKIVRSTSEWNVLHQGDAMSLLEHVEVPRDRAVLLALLLQGWRASELCAMTWAQIREEQIEGKNVHVVEWYSKRKRYRRQGLQSVVLEAAMKACTRQLPKDPFIPHHGTKPMTRFDVYHIVRRYAGAAGFKVTPHGLRATYTSSVIQRKGIEAARQLVGHTSIATTQRYSRWVVDRDDDLTPEDL